MDKLVKMGIISMAAMVLVACGGVTDSTTDGADTTDGVEVVEEDAEEEEEEEDAEESLYTYEDFKGVYVGFEGEPYRTPINSMSSGIIVLEDNYYQTFNRWDFDMTSTIIGKKIEDNVLTLRLDSDEQEQWGLHSESGTEQFELHHDGDKKFLYLVKQDIPFYSMSEQDLQDNYRQSEIDYARIIMTLRGAPTLDAWAVFESEYGYDGDKPIIGITNRNKGDTIPYTDDDNDVGYPEDVTVLYMKNKIKQDEISYTYSSIGEGYIKVYPVPLNHAIRTGKEVIDEAEEKYIEPFEPYEVADFIGRVNFEYQY